MIEFQSTEIPEISLHIPYDLRLELEIEAGYDWDSLPRVSGSQEQYGREPSIEEHIKYPLGSLLENLEYSLEDAPNSFQYVSNGFDDGFLFDDEDESWFGD